ncbi:hypothetical protein [Nostoc sp. 106C]|nr:hypothetical protein [Nostoc sp. 106C]
MRSLPEVYSTTSDRTTLPQQAMSNHKPLRIYALFLSLSARRSLTGLL